MEHIQDEEKKNLNNKKRVNVGARTCMISYVVALTATAFISIYSYFQQYPISWWLIIVAGSFALFLLIGSILQTIIEIQVEKIIAKEEEERKLREIEAINKEPEGKKSTGKDSKNPASDAATTP